MKTGSFFIVPLVAAGLSTALFSCQAPPPQSCDLTPADKDSLLKVRSAATAPVIANPAAADWSAFVDAHYTADATILPPGGTAVQGKDAIVAFMSSMTGITKYSREDAEIEGNGNLVYIRGAYAMSFQVNDSVSKDDTGKYIEIWRKNESGQWRCSRDIFNSDIAPEVSTPDTAAVAVGEAPAEAAPAAATAK
jgi:ketosteroid isomerase-like protein